MKAGSLCRPQGSIMVGRVAFVILLALTAGCATSWLEQSNQEIEAARKSKDSSTLGRALERRAEQYALRAINPENGQSSTVSLGQSSEEDYRAAAKSFIDGSNPVAGLAALRKCVDLLLRAGFGETCDEALLQASAIHDKDREMATRAAFAERLTIRRANRTAFVRSVNQSSAQQEAKREQEKADSERRQRLAAAMLSGVAASTSSQQPAQGTGQTARGVSTPPVTASGQTTQRSSAQTSIYIPQISSGATESNKSNTPTRPKYRSEEANKCVQIVSRNANASCTWQSCIKNACQIDVVARWKAEMDNYWSQTRLRPGGTYRVPADRGQVAYSACSIDPSSGALEPSSKCVYP